ncbi:hypothetical protein A8A54_21650 [Brucella pseudogrignonensis]|jgi:hypothetical protein|uniref:Uncharacterized protein n=1 Tax=Brucella pseudogrignonensis TaxID=419475 RepID=A0A1A9FVC7_9HYPH|nr:hypothetical protein A8A54_21650 [Brucella pseudogrignonensis]OYR23705.1 hypothetical protein CEV34_3709 [Brucella pseudogrignonensis]
MVAVVLLRHSSPFDAYSFLSPKRDFRSVPPLQKPLNEMIVSQVFEAALCFFFRSLSAGVYRRL